MQSFVELVCAGSMLPYLIGDLGTFIAHSHKNSLLWKIIAGASKYLYCLYKEEGSHFYQLQSRL